MRIATQRVLIACFSAAVLAGAGCADGSVNPVSPNPSPNPTSVIAHLVASPSFPRRGTLDVTKDCSAYTGQAGDFCTITASSIREIAVGSKVVYSQAANFSTLSLDTDVALELPGPGNSAASGHCQVDLVTGSGRCTFSGGTGKFTHFRGSVNVSYLGGPDYAWEGTYSFDPRN